LPWFATSHGAGHDPQGVGAYTDGVAHLEVREPPIPPDMGLGEPMLGLPCRLTGASGGLCKPRDLLLDPRIGGPEAGLKTR
jgi:hypothetical protein